MQIMNKSQEYIINQCEPDLQEGMRKAMQANPNRPYPQVFQTGYSSSDFKLDTKSIKDGWTAELQNEYYHIVYDPYDIESNYEEW